VDESSNRPTTIDEYIATSPPQVRGILEKIRRVIRKVAPDAEETISYRIPAFKLHGILLYFAAFKKHIGVFPPISGDARLERDLARYAGEKGNLRFPLDEPMPYDLIERIAKLRVKQNLEKATKGTKRRRERSQRVRNRPNHGLVGGEVGVLGGALVNLSAPPPNPALQRTRVARR